MVSPLHAPAAFQRIVDLAVCILLSVVMVGLALTSFVEFANIALGFLLVVVLPGYALGCVLWGSESGLSVTGRIAFSVGLSAALSVFTVLLISLTGVGIYPVAVTLALSYETVVFAVLAMVLRWSRNEGIPQDVIEAVRRSRRKFQEDRPFWTLVSVLLLAAAILVALVLATPSPGTSTDFFVYGPDGTVSTLPHSLVVNQSGSLLVGTYNALNQQTVFVVTLCLGPGNTTCDTSSARFASWNSTLRFGAGETYRLNLSVPAGETVVNPISFTVAVPGGFFLYLTLDGGAVHQESHLSLTIAP